MVLCLQKKIQVQQLCSSNNFSSSFSPKTTMVALTKPSPSSSARPPLPLPITHSSSHTPLVACTMESGKTRVQEQSDYSSASFVAFIGRSSSVQCHGICDVQKDCPSKQTYIATKDGGYISTSGIEDATKDGGYISTTAAICTQQMERPLKLIRI